MMHNLEKNLFGLEDEEKLYLLIVHCALIIYNV